MSTTGNTPDSYLCCLHVQTTERLNSVIDYLGKPDSGRDIGTEVPPWAAKHRAEQGLSTAHQHTTWTLALDTPANDEDESFIYNFDNIIEQIQWCNEQYVEPLSKLQSNIRCELSLSIGTCARESCSKIHLPQTVMGSALLQKLAIELNICHYPTSASCPPPLTTASPPFNALCNLTTDDADLFINETTIARATGRDSSTLAGPVTVRSDDGSPLETTSGLWERASKTMVSGESATEHIEIRCRATTFEISTHIPSQFVQSGWFNKLDYSLCVSLEQFTNNARH